MTSAETKLKFESNGFSLTSNIETINAALNYLNGFSDVSVLIENEKATEALSYLYSMTATYITEGERLLEIYTNKNLLQLLFNLNEYFSNICGDLKYTHNEGYSSIDALKNKNLWSALQILNFLTVYFLKIRVKYFEMGGTRALLKMIDNENFAKNFHNDDTFTRIVANINWLSKIADLYKSEWQELNAVDTLLKVSRNCPMSKLVAYMTFANIANDKQIDTLNEIHQIIPELTNIVNRAAKNMKQFVKREKQPFIEEDETNNQQYDVYIVPVEEYNTRFTVTGVLLALYKLSVNNTIKYDMYVKYNVREPIRNIIFIGSEIEKKYSLNLLAQLCFDTQVLDIVSKDDELVKQIEFLTKPENCTMKSMRKLCEQITWTITTKNKKLNEEANKQLNEVHQQKQVMISYNSGSRDLCLKIKEALEANNFKVWIDVNEIHGSSLEAMARAVESSDFILMCVTEKYRQSINCQAEAQYSFKLKKKIIPLIMQKGFENVDGWLGIIMGDKIFINFTKYSFEQSVTLMLKELNLNINSSVPNTGNTDVIAHREEKSETIEKVTVSKSFAAPSRKETRTNARNWTEKEVENWMNVKNVPEYIRSMLAPCNGEVLYQLFKLRSSAPEFYYQSITKNSNLDLKSVLLFSIDLEKAFDE